MSEKEYTLVDSADSFEAKLARVRAAQEKYASYTQEQVDAIFKAAALAANNYEWQQIFINKPCVSLAADAVKPDADNGFWFLTDANTQATAITDIDNAKAGVAYIIECGSATNASTIAKSGKFANIKSAWEPSAVGDYIMVILNSEGKFLELERQVGGTRTVNADLQPNIPGVR